MGGIIGNWLAMRRASTAAVTSIGNSASLKFGDVGRDVGWDSDDESDGAGV